MEHQNSMLHINAWNTLRLSEHEKLNLSLFCVLMEKVCFLLILYLHGFTTPLNKENLWFLHILVLSFCKTFYAYKMVIEMHVTKTKSATGRRTNKTIVGFQNVLYAHDIDPQSHRCVIKVISWRADTLPENPSVLRSSEDRSWFQCCVVLQTQALLGPGFSEEKKWLVFSHRLLSLFKFTASYQDSILHNARLTNLQTDRWR